MVAQASLPAVSRVSQPASAGTIPAALNHRCPADWEVGDTAGSETCATKNGDPISEFGMNQLRFVPLGGSCHHDPAETPPGGNGARAVPGSQRVRKTGRLGIEPELRNGIAPGANPVADFRAGARACDPQRSSNGVEESFSRPLRCGDPLRVTDPRSAITSPARLQFDFGIRVELVFRQQPLPLQAEDRSRSDGKAPRHPHLSAKSIGRCGLAVGGRVRQ